MRSTLTFTALLGCYQRFDLSDVPIVGGTDEQRAVVREELEAFDRDVGPGRLRLSAVVFASLTDDRRGFSNGPTNRIRIEEELVPEDLGRIVRHELCHQLDRDEELLAAPVAALDAFAEEQ